MAEGIIDKIMQMFKGMETDDATLTTIEGGMKVDLFKDKPVSEDFDTMLNVLLYDEKGQKVLNDLYESGKVEQLRKLWEMGGSPSLSFGGKSKNVHYTQGKDNVIHLLTRGGKREDYGSKQLFQTFIAELSHGIGEFRPSLNKMSRDDIYSELMDKEGSLFDPAVSPADSSAAWKDWILRDAIKPGPETTIKAFPPEHKPAWTDPKGKLHPARVKYSAHATPGSMEYQTHSVIESAIKWWMKEETEIDLFTAEW